MTRRIGFAIAILVVSLLAITLNAQTVSAQQSVSWRSEFFNNPYLTGSVVHSRTDGQIAYNWGLGSPNASVPIDNFSARISTDVYIPAGSYRFNLLADDGAHVYINFQSKLNTFDQTRPNQPLFFDMTLPGGNVHIQIDYREVTDRAFVFFNWVNLATNAITGPRIDGPLPNTVPTPPPAAVPVGIWQAEYFSNPTLSGAPLTTFNESSPTHNWGYNAPFNGIPADNFSARWRSSQYFDGGVYTLTVRADDGVRVFVNGSLVINAWHGATGQTYTAQIAPAAGYHVITVEYYEAWATAWLDFGLTRNTVIVNPTPPPVVTGPRATVVAAMLNVRSAPITGAVLTQIRRGESYPVVGRTSDSSWWQVRVQNLTGWVSGAYVNTANVGTVPVTYQQPSTGAPQPTGYTVRSLANVNMRGGPSIAYGIVYRLPFGRTAEIVGRNTAATWWQVRYNGFTGWVSGAYALPNPGTDISRIPVTLP